MKKVLMFGVTDTNGGIENFCLNYTRELNSDDFRIDYIDIYDGKLFYKEDFIRLGSKVISIANYRKRPIKAYKELKKIIAKEGYNIIHYNMNSAVFLFPLILGKKLKIQKVIAHSHNAYNDKGLLKSVIHWINKHFITFFANYYFACSDKAARYFFSKKTIKNKNFYIINNAIDTKKFEYSELTRTQKRKELGLENRLVVGHVGRFNKQKNHEFLVKIFESLQKYDKNSVLLLIGTGPLQNKIEEMVKTLNIESKVKILGNRNDVSELMQCMDILVMPSLYEGLSLVTVEAQAAGLLCLLSDNISEQSKILNSTKFYSLNNTPEMWAKKILEMKNNVNDRSSAYKEIVNKGFDIKKECEKIFNIYTEEK